MGCSASLPMIKIDRSDRSTQGVSGIEVVNNTTENKDNVEACTHHEDEESEISSNKDGDETEDENIDENQHNSENVMKLLSWKMQKINATGKVFNKAEIFQALNKVIYQLKNQEDDGLGEKLAVISQAFSAIEHISPLPYDVVESYRREAGRLLAKKEIIHKMCNIIKEGLGDRQHTGVTKQALNILWNFSDCTKEVSHIIASDTKLLQTLVTALEWNIPGIPGQDEQTDWNKELVMSILAIIHNTAMVEENIPSIQSLKIVNMLGAYLESESEHIRLDALAILATIIDERESETLQKKPDAIQFLHNILGNALENPSHQWMTSDGVVWKAKECAFVVRRLAKNDVNKKLLVEMDFLPHLVKLIQLGTVDEQKEAVGAIWSLAFDEKNQTKIIGYENPDVVKMIFQLRRKSDDNDVKKNADGCLRTLLDQLHDIKKYNDIANFYRKGEASKTMEKKGYIMISYNKTHREELKKIRDELQSRGYRVWMDIDDMKGHTYDAMYEAVQSAHIVLMCMSQAYKDSENCRLEAKNAKKHKKNIVPLLMQKGYIADGWLDLILEDKTFYDFSGNYPFEQKFKQLLKEIEDLYGQVSNTVETSTKQVCKSSVTLVRKWTPDDVKIWISRHSLPAKLFDRLTGRDLSALVTMKKGAPECFYKWLQKNLKLNNLSIIDMFMEALSEIEE